MGQFTLGKVGRILLPFNIIIALGVLGCSGPAHRAPVADVRQPPSFRIQEHVVAPGETLYSIAWRYNLDHRDLARANGIGSSYTIFAGQRLNLDVSHSSPTKPPPTVARSQPRSASAPSAPTSTPKPTATAQRSENQTVARRPSSTPSAGAEPAKWQWPIRGRILASFESNGGLNKGIDIEGELGEPVLAAAGGKIVYSGSGLRGYGNLIIVKHSEKYLSAYAHNSKLLVDEGVSVKAGQKIAEVGASGTDTPKLHFEIRYDGKPVDPMKFLPRL